VPSRGDGAAGGKTPILTIFLLDLHAVSGKTAQRRHGR
jgi:hypothetical protein